MTPTPDALEAFLEKCDNQRKSYELAATCADHRTMDSLYFVYAIAAAPKLIAIVRAYREEHLCHDEGCPSNMNAIPVHCTIKNLKKGPCACGYDELQADLARIVAGPG